MNIGLINESLICNSFDSNTTLYESFINDLKSSEYLMNEYIVFNNISCYNVKEQSKSEVIDYIKENLEQLKSHGIKVAKAERKKLNKYSKEVTSNNKLYESINSLIVESVLKPKTKLDVNKIFENYDIIYQTLITRSNIENDSIDLQESIAADELDLVFKNLQTMFSDKYESLLSEKEQRIIALVLNGSQDEKRTLFEDLKKEAITSIEDEKENIRTDIYESSISKINLLPTSDATALENSILSLIEIIY
jgi:hypothetical protein